MTRADLLTTEALEAAGEAAFAQMRIRFGDMLPKPWNVVSPLARSILRNVAATAIHAAYDVAEQKQADAPPCPPNSN